MGRKAVYSSRKWSRVSSVAGMSVRAASDALYHLYESQEVVPTATVEQWINYARSALFNAERLLKRSKEISSSTDGAVANAPAVEQR